MYNLDLGDRDMEAKELQIGDWVKVDDTENPYPLIVTEIYRKSTSYCVHLINNEHNEDITCVADRVWAIPLTEETLKANGFEELDDNLWQNDMFCCGVDNQAGYMELYAYDEDIESDEIFNKIRNLFYVHQLQHALRIVGLDELADNFKVE